MANKEDIVDLILDDHKPLKKLIKVMKDEDTEIDEKQTAFEEFAPLLIAHAKPEESVLYTFIKKDSDMRLLGLEGEVEHGIADQLVQEIKATRDDEECAARIKVLAELVEHHIKEEEDDLLPDFKKKSNSEDRKSLGSRYAQAKARFKDLDHEGASSERTSDESRAHF